MPIAFVTDNQRPDLGGNLRHGDFNTLEPVVWRELVERFAVRSVLDVGCAEGHAVALLARMGVVAHGIDGLRKNVERSVYPVAHHDLTAGPYFMPVNMTLSMEVAEHIEEKYVGHYVETLCNGTLVVMTYAQPGQEGHHHVNCREESYWLDLFRKRGYRLDYYNEHWRKLAQGRNPDSFFGKTGLVLVKDD